MYEGMEVYKVFTEMLNVFEDLEFDRVCRICGHRHTRKQMLPWCPRFFEGAKRYVIVTAAGAHFLSSEYISTFCFVFLLRPAKKCAAASLRPSLGDGSVPPSNAQAL